MNNNNNNNTLAELTKIALEYNKPFREILHKASNIQSINKSTNIIEELRNYYGRQQKGR